MAKRLFPLFMDISQTPILLVGAGEVAARKAEKLLQFVETLDCVAPWANEEMQGWIKQGRIRWQQREYLDSDFENKKIIIVAADNVELQKKIFIEGTQRGVLVNSVDVPEYCHFIFPALVVRDQLVVGISTAGAAPSVASALRQQIEKTIPDSIEELIQQVQDLRAELKKTSLTTAQRGQKVIEFVKAQFKSLNEP